MSRCQGKHPETKLPCPLQAERGSNNRCRGCANRSWKERFLFASWMDRVRQEVEALCGLPPEDLPDCPYRDWHDLAMSPQEAAEAVLERCLE
jgi:hypothetical protein